MKRFLDFLREGVTDLSNSFRFRKNAAQVNTSNHEKYIIRHPEQALHQSKTFAANAPEGFHEKHGIKPITMLTHVVGNEKAVMKNLNVYHKELPDVARRHGLPPMNDSNEMIMHNKKFYNPHQLPTAKVLDFKKKDD